MANATVLIFVESRYKVSRKSIKLTIARVLQENKVQTPVEVSVAIVGDRKMALLNKKYRNKEGSTNVLSFPLSEGETSHLPDDIVRLGDIVVSYPKVIMEASRDDVLVDEKVEELVSHSMLHLLGMHHE